MTLIDRLQAELARLGSASHPLARTLPEIVRESQRCARRVFALALVIAFLLGFLACYTWQGMKMEVLAANVEAWRQTAETEYRTHHEAVKVSKPQAQVITQHKEDVRKEPSP